MKTRGIYRRIYTRMWLNDKFLKLSKAQPNSQTLWIYLITGPHNTTLPGIFHVGERSLGEALGWEDNNVKEKLKELVDENMIEIDPERKMIVIPTAIEYNPPQSPQTPTTWAGQFASLPECPIKEKFLKYLVRFMTTNSFKKKFLNQFSQWLDDEQKEMLKNGTYYDSSKINEFLKFYHDEFLKRFKESPHIIPGKDPRIIKDLLMVRDIETLKNMMKEFLDSQDKFIKNSGRTIGVFSSCFNKLLIKKDSEKNIEYKDLNGK